MKETGQIFVLRSRIILAKIFLICVLTYGPQCVDANILEKLNASFVAHFEEHIAADNPSYPKMNAFGNSSTIKDGVSGKALALYPGQYLTIKTENVFNPEEGTIMFWVRPHWTPIQSGSHTFLSMRWLSPKQAYFVLSKGWWEADGGQPYTYFITNNQEYTNIARNIYYFHRQWMHFACTWKAGAAGFSRLFVNGYEVHRRVPSLERKPHWSAYVPDKDIFIGTDKGTLLPNERWADCDIDELAIFKQALAAEDILRVYRTMKRDIAAPIRDSDGILLETRALFDEGRAWQTEEGAEKVIKKIKRAGFNVYSPCVWHGSGARFPSATAVQEYPPKIFSADPLARLIDIAHKNGIELHAWFTISLRQRDFYPSFFGTGSPAKAFDIHRPAFRQFIVDFITDTVSKYNLDGVLLDYIRTMGHCNCAYCKKQYERQFDRNLVEDIAESVAGGKLVPSLQQWHDEAVEAVVKEVRERVKAIKPHVIVGVYGHLNDGRLNPEGRQLIPWLNAGLIDVLWSGTYEVIPDYEGQRYAASLLKEPVRLAVIPANYILINGKPVSREASDVASIMENLQQRMPMQGKALYDFSFMTDSQVKALSEGPFKESARPLWRSSRFMEMR